MIFASGHGRMNNLQDLRLFPAPIIIIILLRSSALVFGLITSRIRVCLTEEVDLVLTNALFLIESSLRLLLSTIMLSKDRSDGSC